MLYVKISENLKKIRKDKGYSRRELAELCDINEKTIQRAETGERIRKDLADIIAMKLNIHLSNIIINEGYTEAQNVVINSDNKALQTVAGPGSGKTKVMVGRVIKLLQDGIQPRSIAVFTFTEKAADELNHRIKTEIRKNGLIIPGISEMYIGTIHGFCLYILQDILNFYKDFQVLTPVRSRIFVDKYFDKIGIGKIQKLQKREYMKKYIHTTKFLSIVSVLGENEVQWELVPRSIKESVDNYKSLLKKHRYFDFTSIMTEAYENLISNKILRDYIKNNIDYLLVDEYQDVNDLQEKIINEIYKLRCNILVVGDLDQSIYSWRGSDVENFLKFDSRYKDAEKMFLDKNFRSTNGVVDIANKCIRNNIKRDKDVIITPVKHTYDTGDIVYKEFLDPEIEAEFIVDRIVELNTKLKVPLKEIAVLLRVHKLADSIINELDRRNISYIVEGVNKLFETREVEACVNTIKYLCKKVSKEELEESWIKVHPNIKISKVKEGIEYLDSIDITSSLLYSSHVIQNVFWEFLSIIDIIQEENIFDVSLEKVCYNIGKFSQVINDYESINYKTIPRIRFRNFCIFIEKAAIDYYPEGYLENPYITIDGVRIMTIHQAKGLQFAAVFIPGLSNNMFPHQKIGGLSMWHFLPGSSVLKSEKFIEKDIESERRLFYVAITRSKKFLFFTRAKYSRNTSKISEFLIEVKDSYNILEYKKSNDLYGAMPTWSDDGTSEDSLLSLSFSTLTDYSECPFKFKLSHLYAFKQPIKPQNGYGSIMHNIVNDINKSALNENNLKTIDLDSIIEENFFLPYLSDGALYDNLKKKCDKSTETYYKKLLDDKEAIIEYVEQKIEAPISKSIILKGRIDLVKKIDKNTNTVKVYVVDFKTESENMKESDLKNSEVLGNNRDISLIDEARKTQLLIYCLGYENLTGNKADFIQIYNLDNNNKDTQIVNSSEFIELKKNIIEATDAIANDSITKQCSKEKCSNCFLAKLCVTREEKEKYNISFKEN